ncbi:uncharacterized protein LOC131682241, partial [Topomyia yanbarensis]|uniref:uncharacterized protein LOC131682241 n=1 Tax=Topomyia yanbarensis TaxID=2498891 RepID=UPI00273BFD63
MFTVAQFFEKQQLRVLAVPVSWVRGGFLMWPKLPSNEKLDKLRMEGIEYHGATKKIPVIVGRKYKSLQAAEAAAEDLLKQEVSDIENKRNLLKHRKGKATDASLFKDYNKIIQEMSEISGQIGSVPLAQQKQVQWHRVQIDEKQIEDAPLQDKADETNGQTETVSQAVRILPMIQIPLQNFDSGTPPNPSSSVVSPRQTQYLPKSKLEAHPTSKNHNSVRCNICSAFVYFLLYVLFTYINANIFY